MIPALLLSLFPPAPLPKVLAVEAVPAVDLARLSVEDAPKQAGEAGTAAEGRS